LPCDDTEETVGWFAIEESKGSIGGRKYEAIKIPAEAESNKVGLSWVGSNPQIYGTGSSGGLELHHAEGDEMELHRDPDEEVSILTLEETPSDSTIKALSLENVATSWHATRWSSCGAVCSQGLRTRQVKCMSSVDGGLEMAPHHCLGVQPAEGEKMCVADEGMEHMQKSLAHYANASSRMPSWAAGRGQCPRRCPLRSP